MKSIDKLRTAARNMAIGSNLEKHDECNLLLIIADEIEAEIEDLELLIIDGYPEPFNTPDAMHMVLGTAADNFDTPEEAVGYLRGDTSMLLPVDADGVPIRPDDLMACTAFDTNDFDGKEHVMAVGNGFWVDKDGCTHIPSETHHVKPRTLEDVLEDYVVEYQTRHARSKFGAEHFDHVDVHEMVKRYADEIRELLGFEIDDPDTIRNELEDNGEMLGGDE